MVWFDWLYPAVMIASPAVITLLAGGERDPVRDQDRERILVRRLWTLTLLVLALHVAAQLALARGLAPSADARRAITSSLPLAAFFPLWFGVAGPLLALRHPGWRPSSAVQGDQRSASLVPRHAHDPIARSTWVAGWIVFAACAAVMGWAVWRAGNPALLLGLTFWPGFAFGARASRLEAEPRDARGSTELDSAWASYRSFRAHGFLVCGLGGCLVFALAALLMVVAPQAAGLVGGLGGALVGVVGAVFGTLASVRRARIQGLLARLGGDEPAGC